MSGFLDRIFPSKNASPTPRPTQAAVPPVETQPAAQSPPPAAGEPPQPPAAARPATVTPPVAPPAYAASVQQQPQPTAVEPSSPLTPPPPVQPLSASPVQQQAQQAALPLPAKPRGRAKQLMKQREAALRDLGGLLYEMYHRDRFRKDLLDFKCGEIGRIDGEIRALTYGPLAAPVAAPQPPSNQSPAA